MNGIVLTHKLPSIEGEGGGRGSGLPKGSAEIIQSLVTKSRRRKIMPQSRQ